MQDKEKCNCFFAILNKHDDQVSPINVSVRILVPGWLKRTKQQTLIETPACTSKDVGKFKNSQISKKNILDLLNIRNYQT